jgi:hypothetical protein
MHHLGAGEPPAVKLRLIQKCSVCVLRTVSPMGRAGAVRKHCMSWLVGVLSHSAAPLRLIGDGCIFTFRRPRGPPAELDDDASQALRCGGQLCRAPRGVSRL